MDHLLLLLFAVRLVSSDVTFTSSLAQFTESRLVVQKEVLFVGQYNGPASAVQWSVPEECDHTIITPTIAQFVCHTHGFHNINVTIGDDTQSYSLHTEERVQCYKWGLAYDENVLELHVTNQAGVQDNRLALQFYSLGETPTISVNCDKTSSRLPKPVYNTTRDTWVVGNVTLDTCHSVTVSSVPVLLFKCAVAETTLPLYTNKMTGAVQGTAAAKTTKTRLCKDYCNSGVAVLLNSDGDAGEQVLFTNDDFATFTKLTYPAANKIKDCGVLYNGVLLLLVTKDTKDILVTVYSDALTTTVELNTTVEHITVNTQCRSYAEEHLNASVSVLWSDTEFLVFYSGEIVDTVDTLPYNMSNIHSVGVSYFGVSAIMSNSSSTMFVQYHTSHANFSQGVELGVSCDGGCKLHGICPHLYLLEATNLSFITPNGVTMPNVTDSKHVSPLSLSLQSVAISSSDVWALLTTDKMLYYGYCAKSGLVKIVNKGLPDANDVLFDSTLQLYYITSSGQRTPLPSSVLLKAALNTQGCPVREYTTSANRSVVYLDKGEVFEYEVQTLTTDHYPSTVLYQKYPQHLLSLHIQSVVAPSRTTRGQNHITQHVNVTGASTVQGLTVITSTPAAATPPCPTAFSDVVYVAVDCPKSRRLVVKGKNESCVDIETIVGEYNTQGEEMNVTYNVTEFGCPIMWPPKNRTTEEDFLPEVWIYDNDVPVRQVTTDFVLREVNERTDFEYSKSVGDVKCLRVAQTHTEAWSQEAYLDCFQTENSTLQLTKSERKMKYEVLNSTGTNRVVFERSVAIFIFQLTVVGYNTSYCTLSTKFGVWIKDAPTSSEYVGPAVLVLTCLVMVVILLLSYYHYKKHILAKTKMVLES